MKIVHTSDWHVGRRWKGIQRLDEMAAVLEHLADFIESQAVDLVLHSGDVFDARNPPAAAEQLVNGFFLRMQRAGVPMVVIAGNHDHPGRLDACALLAKSAQVHILGEVRSAQDGGTLHIITRSGEEAIVAALPFAHPGTWSSALQLGNHPDQGAAAYTQAFHQALAQLCQPFRSDTVNLVMAHTHLKSARIGSSERSVSIQDDWHTHPDQLPTQAHYVALGHIHQAQCISQTPPAYYAGSPLQMDFGEVGQDKRFVLVHAHAGQAAKVEQHAYKGGLPLLDVRITRDELERYATDCHPKAWLRVTVPLDQPDPDLNRKVRALLPNALVVKAQLPETSQGQEPTATNTQSQTSPLAQYAAYHQQQYAAAPDATIRQAFAQLYTDAQQQGEPC